MEEPLTRYSQTSKFDKDIPCNHVASLHVAPSGAYVVSLLYMITAGSFLAVMKSGEKSPFQSPSSESGPT
jgi:hypothetical protein